MNSTTYTPVVGHPLDVIPWARRIPQSVGRNLLYTLILSALTTVLFSAIELSSTPHASFKHVVFETAVFSLCIGYSMHLFSMGVGRSLVRLFPGVSQSLRITVAIITSIFAGAFGFWLGSRIVGLTTSAVSGMMIVSVQVGVALTAIAGTHRRFVESQLELERERNARIEAQRLMTAARLQTLQAQIEPHFLFNTLANVSSLIEIEPKQARTMLDQFTLLLRASLDQTRKATTSLRSELQVVEAYLSVLKVRMGERLSFRIDAPGELMNLEVPAMLLQPIVENAVKHGIEPRVKGGTVRVDVSRENSQLIFAVADDGVGFVVNKKENVGLGAVRETLAVQFGDKASLEIERTPENWTRVVIRIPMLA
ncbi:MAG TPA: histidine kinase [Steroidobacteraceae bacterium]|nr:histidine kinase [Steroidobacteraceae bacterium]